MQNSTAVIKSNALVDVLIQLNPVFGKIAGMMSHDAVMHIAPSIVEGLAITQKDTLPTLLDIGARYFRFVQRRLSFNAASRYGRASEYFSHSMYVRPTLVWPSA